MQIFLFALLFLSGEHAAQHHHDGLCGCEQLVRKHAQTGHAITTMKANGENLVITEIMQNPNAVGDTSGEWFEVFNPGTSGINLNGWIIRDNGSDSHTINTNVTVAPGSYAVLGRNANASTNGGIQVDYQYSGFTLANGADEVVLVRPDASIADEVAYTGAAPWPDPTGASMELSSATVDNSIPANWSAATATLSSGDKGTPGDGPDAVQNLVITEIMQNPNAVADDQGEWFEVFNPGGVTVNMNGWRILDEGSDSHTIQSDVLVAPNNYVVLGRNTNLLTNGGVNVAYGYTSFVLSNSADEIILQRPDGTQADIVRYTGSNPWPDPTGASMELNSAALDNAVGGNWSTATQAIGSGDFGTPRSGPDGGGSPGGNLAPVVDAGSPVTAYLDTTSVTVSLLATASDPNGDPMTYSWSLVSGNAANVSIATPSAIQTDVVINALGSYSLEFSANDSEFTSSDTVVITVEERPVFSGNYQVYFGNLHAHSAYSDGNKANDPNYNNVENSFRFARDSGGLDWLLMADHNHNSAGMTLSEFNAGVTETNTVNNESSNFTAIYGSEWGTISTGGHVIFASDQLVGWETGNYDVFVAKGDYTGLFSYLNTVGGFAELCHPSSNHFDNIFNSPYNAAWDNVISMVAIRSGPAFATETDFSNPSNTSYLSYYYNLLLKGYHVGPAGDQDTHYDNWGLANEQRTAVLATENTPAAIREALKAGRVYAVQDRNVFINYEASYQGQSYQMASSIQASVGSNVSLQATITDSDNETISSVELWGGQIGGSNVSLIQSSSGNQLSYAFSPTNVGQTDFFLVIAIQADGQRAWSSPIWIEGSNATSNPSPTSQFTFSAQGLTASFTDQSTDDGSINSWAWNFGDGATSTAQNPSYTYSAAGTYTAALTVTDNLGASATSNDTVIVNQSTSQWVTLESNDFENGWGNFVDGGGDCRRSSADSNYANSGTFCVRLRDNSGTASSTWTNNGFDLTSYGEFRIEFSYIANSMENGEDFFVEYWDGSNWVVVGNYVRGVDFNNGARGSVTINLTPSTAVFHNAAGIRIRCDASANGDQIYIDDIVLSAR